MMQRALVVAGIWLVACGPKAEPAKTAGASANASQRLQRREQRDTGCTGTFGGGAAWPLRARPRLAAKPAAPSIHDVCFEMCDKVKAKCPKSAFEACRVNCSKYESPGEGCEDVAQGSVGVRA